MPKGVCFVCLGNICRSPLAEGVFNHLAEQAGLDGQVIAESAATSDYHVGERPDPRAGAVARQHGIELRSRARQFHARDFARYDAVIAMDRANREHLRRIAPTPADRARVRLLRDYDPLASGEADVPDPYYGGPDGFEKVYQMIERSCRALLEELAHGYAP
ncbi:MAG: low molecular weight phosphotyrosine protein phosphatase [Chloroflexi bacterium]|nr:low molecular weight phosphotyrosine protein phosphatase [Chloroflexota bacterium]